MMLQQRQSSPHNDRALRRRGGSARATISTRHARSVAKTVDAFRDRGQATTEYALVMLGAALVGVLVIGWATSGGGASAINRLFSAVIDSVIGNV